MLWHHDRGGGGGGNSYRGGIHVPGRAMGWFMMFPRFMGHVLRSFDGLFGYHTSGTQGMGQFAIVCPGCGYAQ